MKPVMHDVVATLPPPGWQLPEDQRPIAMLLGNRAVRDDQGGFFGALNFYVGGSWGKLVWRCEHSHLTEGEANNCAAKEWFAHHG